MTFENNRANLLCYIKPYTSFRHHMWIKTGVTVRKQINRVLTSVTLTFNLWPWPFAWTSLLSIVIIPENVMIIQWEKPWLWKRCDGQTRQTDGHLYWIFDISIRWSLMHHILLRHTYVVIFLQLFSLIISFHLILLIVFNTADLLIIPPILQHCNWSSNNKVDLPTQQLIFQWYSWSSNNTIDLLLQ